MGSKYVRFAELLEVSAEADGGERSMTVREWDRHQRETARERAKAARTYERDTFANQRTD